MANISFYLFETSQERQANSACRLARKLIKKQPKLWWLCEDTTLQRELDEQLWQFDPQSFIPHGIDQVDAPVCISAQLPTQSDWFVFNFNTAPLAQADQFSHIIEIVENNETSKQQGREKFKFYRQMGIVPRTFKI